MAWFREAERGLAMSIRQTAVPAGGGLGALTLPSLAAHFGFVAVYGTLAALCTMTAWFAWRWLHEPPESAARGVPAVVAGQGAQAGGGKPGVSAGLVPPLRDIGVWRVALGIGVGGVSATMAAVQAGAAVARVWSGHWTDRRGNRRQYMRACSVLTALLFAALALVAAGAGGAQGLITAVLAAMVVLGGVSASAWHGVAYTELATLAGTRRAGTALAMGNTCAFMTLFVTPLAIPPLLTATSWPVVWAVASLCALLALPIFPRPLRAPRYVPRIRV